MATSHPHPSRAIAAFGAVLALRVALAAHWDLLADEAWYLAWSDHLAWGYYDQPPAIAWVLAAERATLGSSSLALRAVPLACGLVVAAALYPLARDRALWLAWCALLPPVGWLSVFATPDALLLAAWSVGLAGAIQGGRGWLLAGLAAGLAFEAKHTGALLLPLLWLGAPEDWRGRWPWLAALPALALAAPNLAWLAGHDWITARFQLAEGLVHPDPPGAMGPVLQLAGQILLATPLLGLCALGWALARAPATELDRVRRLAWWTSAPLLAFFALAATRAPAEAHWPAPAWIGLGLGLCCESGRWARAAWLGIGLGAPLVGLAAIHGLRPVFPLPADPASRLSEGPVLGGMVARIAAPDPGEGAGPLPVYTERYQEAGLIAHYAQIPAAVHPGCGRAGQQDLWGDPFAGAPRAWFVRPHTGGPPDCLAARWRVRRGPVRLEGTDPAGRPVGPWDLFELEAR